MPTYVAEPQSNEWNWQARESKAGEERTPHCMRITYSAPPPLKVSLRHRESAPWAWLAAFQFLLPPWGLQPMLPDTAPSLTERSLHSRSQDSTRVGGASAGRIYRQPLGRRERQSSDERSHHKVHLKKSAAAAEDTPGMPTSCGMRATGSPSLP